MLVGTVGAFFWLLRVHAPTAGPLKLVQQVTGGTPSILMDHPNWPFVDPIVAILPVSAVVFIVVGLLTAKPHAEHLRRCFR